MLKPPDQNNDIGDKIIRAFSQPIKSNPHTKKLKHLDSHMSLNLTPEQSEKRVIMLGFCLSLILLGACSILTSMSIYQRLQKENQKITIHNKHTESKTYTILFIISTYNIFWWFKFKIWGLQRLNMIWRFVKDLDLPKFWPYGGLKVPKIKNEALKNNLLSTLRGRKFKNSRRHEQDLYLSLVLATNNVICYMLFMNKWKTFLHLPS